MGMYACQYTLNSALEDELDEKEKKKKKGNEKERKENLPFAIASSKMELDSGNSDDVGIPSPEHNED